MVKEVVTIQEAEIVNDALLKDICKRLYGAGMNVYQIASELNITSQVARNLCECGEKSYPNCFFDYTAINAALAQYREAQPAQGRVNFEKERGARYNEIEDKALSIMQKLLDYYDARPFGDIKEDAFRAQLASNFIKSTQMARDEAIKKLEFLQKQSDNKIIVEFIE